MSKNQLTLKMVRKAIEQSGHHPQGMSGINTWENCAGSVLAQIDLPDLGNDYAVEGTKAHDLAERMGTGQSWDPEEYPAEMVEHMQGYIQYVQDNAEGGRVFYEQGVDLTHIVPECFGTADAVILSGNVLKIIDLKYGMGFVPAETNQLKGYLSGAIETLAKKGIYPDILEAHIYQPRNGGARMVEYTLEDIKDFEDRVSIAAIKCFEPDPELNPGEKQCLWCRAKSTCPALYEQAIAIVGDDFEVLPDPNNLPDSKLKDILDHKELIEKWLKSIESEVFSRFEHGRSFPGYKVVHGRSMRKYKKDAADKMEQMFGDQVFDKKLKNITTLEKQLGKKHFAELDLTTKPEGKPVLVTESDPRPAIEKITDDFDVV